MFDKITGGDKYVYNHDEAYYNKYIAENEKHVNLLPGKTYLCPLDWPMAKDAKQVQFLKSKYFKEHGFSIGADSKHDDIYSLV